MILRTGCQSLLRVPSFSGLHDPERNYCQPVTLWIHKNVSNLLYPNRCYLETSLCSVFCSSCFSNKLPIHLTWPPDFSSALLPPPLLQPSARPSVLSCAYLCFWFNSAPHIMLCGLENSRSCLSVRLTVCMSHCLLLDLFQSLCSLALLHALPHRINHFSLLQVLQRFPEVPREALCLGLAHPVPHPPA